MNDSGFNNVLKESPPFWGYHTIEMFACPAYSINSKKFYESFNLFIFHKTIAGKSTAFMWRSVHFPVINEKRKAGNGGENCEHINIEENKKGMNRYEIRQNRQKGNRGKTGI